MHRKRIAYTRAFLLPVWTCVDIDCSSVPACNLLAATPPYSGGSPTRPSPAFPSDAAYGRPAKCADAAACASVAARVAPSGTADWCFLLGYTPFSYAAAPTCCLFMRSRSGHLACHSTCRGSVELVTPRRRLVRIGGMRGRDYCAIAMHNCWAPNSPCRGPPAQTFIWITRFEQELHIGSASLLRRGLVPLPSTQDVHLVWDHFMPLPQSSLAPTTTSSELQLLARHHAALFPDSDYVVVVTPRNQVNQRASTF